MAAVSPTPIGNGCKGKHADNTPNLQLKCVKSFDQDGLPVYTCATYKYFRVNCPKLNKQCSNLSGGWVAAITVCNQQLY